MRHGSPAPWASAALIAVAALAHAGGAQTQADVHAPFEAWFDADSHLLARTAQVRGARTVAVSFSDHRRVDGLVQAGMTTIDSSDGPKAIQTMTLGEVAYLTALDPGMFAAPRTGLADASIAGGAAQVSLPLRLVDNRPYAEVSVDRRGPFLFILDTGANNTVYAPLARALGLDVQGRAVQQGAGEGMMEAGFAKVAEFAIGGARIKDQIVAVEPDDLANVEGLGDQGILGFETFRRYVVRVDYGRGVLTLIDPDRFEPTDAGTPLHIDFEGDLAEVKGKFDGLPVRLIVDTGSRAEVVLNKPFVQRNHLMEKHPRGLDTVAGWGTGGPAYAYATRGGELDVGSIAIPGEVAFFSTQKTGAFANSSFDGEIGGGVLKRFVVTFDYAHQTMYLKPTDAPATDVGGFDRAGMWFNKSQAGFLIAEVVRGGPAAKAGLKPGDELIAVDGRSTKRQNVYDLRLRLRSDRPGSVVRLTIRRNGGLHTSVVTLRDLI